VKLEGLGVLLLTDQGHEAGNVHPGRTGALTGSAHEARAHPGLAVPVADVLVVLLLEMPQCREYRVRSGLTEAAERGFFDLIAELDKLLDVAFLPSPSHNTGHHFEDPFSPDLQGARTCRRIHLHKVEEEPCHVLPAGVLVHDDKAPPSHDRPQLLLSVE
jgi:hypothetical protein